jgi:hypothetical protein
MKWLTPKVFALIVATLACAAAFGSVALAYPRTVSNAALGAEWQCRKALFMTTCSRVSRIEPAVHRRFRDDANDIRRV